MLKTHWSMRTHKYACPHHGHATPECRLPLLQTRLCLRPRGLSWGSAGGPSVSPPQTPVASSLLLDGHWAGRRRRRMGLAPRATAPLIACKGENDVCRLTSLEWVSAPPMCCFNVIGLRCRINSRMAGPSVIHSYYAKAQVWNLNETDSY